jgi:hypothetical protein
MRFIRWQCGQASRMDEDWLTGSSCSINAGMMPDTASVA